MRKGKRLTHETSVENGNEEDREKFQDKLREHPGFVSLSRRFDPLVQRVIKLLEGGSSQIELPIALHHLTNET